MPETLKAAKKAHDDYFKQETAERFSWSVVDSGKAFWPERDGSSGLKSLWESYQKALTAHDTVVLQNRNK